VTHSSSGIIVSTGLDPAVGSNMPPVQRMLPDYQGKNCKGKPQGDFEWDANFVFLGS
jgi:hypothetical protein